MYIMTYIECKKVKILDQFKAHNMLLILLVSLATLQDS